MPILSKTTNFPGTNLFQAGRGLVAKMARMAAIAFLSVAVSSPVFVSSPSEAFGDTRSLKLYFVHTGEKATITFKRNGKFDPKGLEQLNRFLRDWRKNQPTKMDPRLFDLIWEVYQQSGSRNYIHVVCGFRSPATNAMLKSRSKSSGVAEKSQHMLGKAMDFYIPDVKLATLRAIGMKMQVGGVGFYPKSGSPFVHMDVGNVRAWPRMSRQELVQLFPNGKTVHIPADGKPLPGYQQALVDHKSRAGSSKIEIASVSEQPKRKTLFATLFGGGADEEEDNEPVVAAAPAKAAKTAPVEAEAPAEAPVEAEVLVASKAPLPQNRPAFDNNVPGVEMANAMLPANAGNAAQQAFAEALPASQDSQSFADLKEYKVPVPSLLEARNAPSEDVASLNDEMLASVPMPSERPVLTETASADMDDALDESDEDTLREVAETENMPSDMISNMSLPQEDSASSVEVASLDSTVDISTGAAAKSGRPTKVEAQAADANRASVRTEPKLAKKMIARWALSNDRVDIMEQPVKAPRINASLRTPPTTVYAEGFSVKTASIDPSRFSGPAVNFLEVRKFNVN